MSTPRLPPVFVTGAASGIGRAVAERLGADARDLALFDVDGDRLEAVAQPLRRAGATVVAAPVDLRDATAVDAAFRTAADGIGAPGGLVTSAGIDRGGLAHEIDLDDFDAVLAVNLRGTFLACRAVLAWMMQRGGGAVVCVSSPLGLVAVPGGTSAYSASKAGVSALVRTLAVDYARNGIRVNAVLPGPTETDLMWASVAPEHVDAVRATVRHEVPLGRLAAPSEPARAAVWLLSDDASYVTGAQLACDGGVLAKASISV